MGTNSTTKIKIGKMSLSFEDLEVESSDQRTATVIPLPDFTALAAKLSEPAANGTGQSPALPTTDKPAAPAGERRPGRRAGVK